MGTLEFGDLTTVLERAADGSTVWLCLANGTGWGYERAGGKRRMSEVVYTPVSREMASKELMVCPRLDYELEVPQTPHLPLADAGQSLKAGAIIKVLGQATVVVPTSSWTDKLRGHCSETPRMFYRVYEQETKIDGWIPSTYTNKSEDWTLVVFHCERVRPSLSEPVPNGSVCVDHEPVVSGWISVLPNVGVVQVYQLPGRSEVTDATLSAGHLAEVYLKLNAANLTFYKLSLGGWVCETDAKGNIVLVQVQREDHAAEYLCESPHGAAIRSVPTRCKAKNTGQRLQVRDRVLVTESARFPNGDMFLHLKPPLDGWVPSTTIAGRPKMALTKSLGGRDSDRSSVATDEGRGSLARRGSDCSEDSQVDAGRPLLASEAPRQAQGHLPRGTVSFDPHAEVRELDPRVSTASSVSSGRASAAGKPSAVPESPGGRASAVPQSPMSQASSAPPPADLVGRVPAAQRPSGAAAPQMDARAKASMVDAGSGALRASARTLTPPAQRGTASPSAFAASSSSGVPHFGGESVTE